jgi:hypothetical protein
LHTKARDQGLSVRCADTQARDQALSLRLMPGSVEMVGMSVPLQRMMEM